MLNLVEWSVWLGWLRAAVGVAEAAAATSCGLKMKRAKKTMLLWRVQRYPSDGQTLLMWMRADCGVFWFVWMMTIDSFFIGRHVQFFFLLSFICHVNADKSNSRITIIDMKRCRRNLIMLIYIDDSNVRCLNAIINIPMRLINCPDNKDIKCKLNLKRYDLYK